MSVKIAIPAGTFKAGTKVKLFTQMQCQVQPDGSIRAADMREVGSLMVVDGRLVFYDTDLSIEDLSIEAAETQPD